jgi:hypothetical protein
MAFSDWYDMDGKPMDLIAWSNKYEGLKRRVAFTELPGGVHVSTVLLGLDHSFGQGRPIIFETLVFNGPHNGDMDRYATREEAEAGHKAMVSRMVASLKAAA